MSNRIENYKKWMGVTSWHNKGYKGQGINILNTESLDDSHSIFTRDAVVFIAPDSNVYSADVSLKYNGGIYEYHRVNYNDSVYDWQEFVDLFSIDGVTRSIGSSGTYYNEYKYNYWNQFVEDGILFSCSAGNDGGSYDMDTVGSPFPPEISFAIGAISYQESTDTFIKAGYSSTGPDLDFVTFPVTQYGVSGTSFASPAFMGLCAVIMSRCGKMKFNHIYEFLQDISIDIGIEGFDWNHGWGFPYLPQGKCVQMVIDNPTMIIEDNVKEEVVLDQPPKILNGRTLLPVRALAEALGYSVGWDGKTKTITITRDDDKIIMVINSTEMYIDYNVNDNIDGEIIELSQAPVIDVDTSRTLVPVRALCEALNCVLAWSEYDRKVSIFEMG